MSSDARKSIFLSFLPELNLLFVKVIIENEEVNNLSEEIKNEEIVEEVETTEEVVETPEKSELDLANERAEEFEKQIPPCPR